MVREEFIKLKIDDLVYRVDNPSQVRKIASEFTGDPKDDSAFWTRDLGDNYHDALDIPVSDFDKWERMSDFAPIEAKFSVLSHRFFELESFVYNRLN